MLRNLKAFGLATIVSLAIVLIGQGPWQPLVIANLRFHPEIPWAAPAMGAILAGLIAYLSGRGGPASTSAARRRLLRWNPMPMRTFVFAVAVGAVALVAFGGLWIAVSDLVHIPAGIQPRMTGVPLHSAIVFLLVSAMAAPLSEEAAFRGYAMGILEDAWGSPLAAILGSTVLFAAAHVLQGLDPIKLSLYFAAGLIFALTARLTGSLYAAMVVHGLGDILGFTVLWPHDAHPHAMGFGDPLFGPAFAAAVLCTPLAVVGFGRLARPGKPSALGAAQGARVGC